MTKIYVSYNYLDGSGCAIIDVKDDFKISEMKDIKELGDAIVKDDKKIDRVVITNWKWLPDGPQSNTIDLCPCGCGKEDKQ